MVDSPIYCTARQCSPLWRNFMECSINNQALLLLMKHLVTGQRLKTPNFSAFHWSPCGSLVSIGQHFVATRVVHLPKCTETSLITESDQSGPNHQLLQPTLVISTSIISKNRLSRRENLVLCLTQKSTIRSQNIVEKR